MDLRRAKDADRASPQTTWALDLDDRRRSSPMLYIPAATFRALTTRGELTLWFVHHMLYDTSKHRVWALSSSVSGRHTVPTPRVRRGLGGRGARHPMLVGARRGPRGGPRYHLSLVPRMLAECAQTSGSLISRIRRGSAGLLPDTARSGRPPDSRGVLGADHAGFHCQRWADAFLSAAISSARSGQRQAASQPPRPCDQRRRTSAGRRRRSAPSPGSEPDVQARVASCPRHARRKLIVRIDRTELSKNIIRGLEAYRELLVTHPEWRGETHLSSPTRHAGHTPVSRVHVCRDANGPRDLTRVRHGDWQPLVLSERDYPRSLASTGWPTCSWSTRSRRHEPSAKEAPSCPITAARSSCPKRQAPPPSLAPMLCCQSVRRVRDARALHEALIMHDAERKRRTASLALAAVTLPPPAGSPISLRR